MSKLRIIYAGTPDFAAPALKALHDSGFEVVAVFTQPDRPAGRGQKLRASAVKELALQLDIPVFQPLSLRTAEIKKQLRALNADVMVVAAYGLILPKSVLEIPRLGCINIHASLLPRWRGAAPIHRAIEAGDTLTGITIMQMDAGLDTGDILSMHPIPINTDDTSQSLHDRLSDLGADAIVSTLSELDQQAIKPIKQNDEEATYANKLQKSEAKIDWSLSAEDIARKVRAFNPWPCAYTSIHGKNFKVWVAEPSAIGIARMLDVDAQESDVVGHVVASNVNGIFVQTGKGLLRLLEVQIAGKKRVSFMQFINATDLTGLCFGQSAESIV